jgi:enoyl-[acyl-carrier protein] reductase I
MLLKGKRGLVLNVVNRNSIGWKIAQAAADHGAKVGVGAQNERMAEGVQKLLQEDPRFDMFMIDFSDDEQFDALRKAVAKRYKKIDFVVHSAAYAPREALMGRFVDTSREAFQIALDVSCYSLVKLCNALEPVLNDDASIMAMSYLGSMRAVENYNVMGVAKAALESSVRYLTIDLGKRGIRVNALSPGPINTVAARGVKDLSKMIDYVHDRAPLKRTFAQEEVADSAVYLMSDLSRAVTGQVIYIDNGYNIMGL